MRFLARLVTLVSFASAIPASLAPRDTSVTQSKALHILPLGASITFGFKSSDGNGYRKFLRESLSPASVTFVGTQCSGSMTNANNEGHPGWTISQMNSVAANNFGSKPNVVLVYVGTNDAKFSNPTEATRKMEQLVSLLTKNLPGSLIVISKLFPTTDAATNGRIKAFNEAIGKIAWPGNVVVADLSTAVTTNELVDGTHPNDSGYAKMAAVFSEIISSALSAGKIPDGSALPGPAKYCNGPPPAASRNAGANAQAQIQTTTSPIPTLVPAPTPTAANRNGNAAAASAANSAPLAASTISSGSASGATIVSPQTSAINSGMSSTPATTATPPQSASPRLSIRGSIPAAVISVLMATYPLLL